MKPRRGATNLAGVLALDKPPHMTSHDVVAEMRKMTGEQRIGHTGTLDPMATGLMLILVGRATRLERYFSGQDKTYQARITFGTATDTLDAEGTVIEMLPVPTEAGSATWAQKLLTRFVGRQMQVPPAFSAVKSGGVPAYRLSRRGQAPVLAPREIEVYAARLLGVDAAAHTWDVSFTVSKGTYIRVLADAIGRAAGTVAHLSALRRTSIAHIDSRLAITLDEARALVQDNVLEKRFLSVLDVLGFPIVEVEPHVARSGRPIPFESLIRVSAPLSEGLVVSVTSAAAFHGVYVCAGDVLRAETVFDPGLPL